MNVVVNGQMTNYQKVGKGKVVICLPGWADTGVSFSKLTEVLQEHYTVLSLDLPGFGGTQAPPHAWGLNDYSKFVGDWLKKISINETYAIVGHSYGGAVAIDAIASKEVRVKKLVLLASAGIRNKKIIRKKILKAAAKTAKAPLMLLPANKRRRLRRKVYSAIGSDLTLLPHMELTFKRMIGEDVQLAAQTIKTPTLLIYGTKDRDTPVADGRKISAAIKNSKLEVMDGGHFLHQEQPEAVAQLVEEFLNA
ncbi:alpha/beta hydrolase [Candidatus Saccharibacteria bacterium]|nr:alpha/beta hydrolase [Candidatus Saccharibacteria bacterium]